MELLFGYDIYYCIYGNKCMGASVSVYFVHLSIGDSTFDATCIPSFPFKFSIHRKWKISCSSTKHYYFFTQYANICNHDTHYVCTLYISSVLWGSILWHAQNANKHEINYSTYKVFGEYKLLPSTWYKTI